MPPKNFNPKTTTWSGERRQEAQELSGDPKRLRAKNREVHRQYSNVGYNTPVSASVSQGGADSSYVGFVSHARVSVDFLGKVVATAFNPEYVGMLLDNKYITPDQARWCISMCSYAGVIPPYNLVEHAATDSETGEAVNPTEKSNARMETCYTMGLNFRGKKAPQEFIEWCRCGRAGSLSHAARGFCREHGRPRDRASRFRYGRAPWSDGPWNHGVSPNRLGSVSSPAGSISRPRFRSSRCRSRCLSSHTAHM